MLGRFQNSSVPVLNFSRHSVPVSIGFTKTVAFGSGSRFYYLGIKVLKSLQTFIKVACVGISNSFSFAKKLIKFAKSSNFGAFFLFHRKID